ncbi:MAG: PaaI family thioesterase [Bryobacteraceae bacterium]|jgi:uncharacterized protein (TIGR00369 family)
MTDKNDLRWKPPLTFPVADFLGISFTTQSNGNAVAEFHAQANHANPMGTLHGGILCDLADAVMGVAFGTTLGAGESFTTLELKINFLGPVWTGLLKAEAGCSLSRSHGRSRYLQHHRRETPPDRKRNLNLHGSGWGSG